MTDLVFSLGVILLSLVIVVSAKLFSLTSFEEKYVPGIFKSPRKAEIVKKQEVDLLDPFNDGN